MLVVVSNFFLNQIMVSVRFFWLAKIVGPENADRYNWGAYKSPLRRVFSSEMSWEGWERLKKMVIFQ